jgi:anti-sigma regulatory factor (Ser/Thr protein kinase)
VGLDRLTETIELLVSELVTNAVKATAGQGQPVPIRLRLSSDKARFLIEVWDADPRPPMPKDLGADGRPALGDEGGRGLFLVGALSERWSWYASREWGGKVVWCELGAPQPDGSDDSGAAPQILLPRRTPDTRGTRPVRPMDDPHTLRRILDGLRGLDYA